MTEVQPRLVRDILSQSDSFARVLAEQLGAGRAALLRAAALVRSAGRVVIVGMGASLNACIPFENLLCSRGIDAFCVEAGEFLHYRREAYRDAILIAVSRSGESVEIVELLSGVRGRMPVIGVTNDPSSTLAREASVAIDVHSLLDEFVAIQSYTGTLLALHLLGMAAANQLDEGRREIDALYPKLSGWIAASLDAWKDWDEFLAHDSHIYILGRGPSYGSALQGALLFGEIAKAPASGMALASFRHGPIEVTGPNFRGLIFAPRGPTLDLNVGLAGDLLRFGGSVRLIGAAGTDETSIPRIDTPVCRDMLAPMVEIVPVQVAAVRLAQLRGITVGSFRFAPQVVRDEARIAI